jgi:hypothetical protein
MTRRRHREPPPSAPDPFAPHPPDDSLTGAGRPMGDDADPLPPLHIPSLDWSAPDPERMRARRERRRGRAETAHAAPQPGTPQTTPREAADRAPEPYRRGADTTQRGADTTQRGAENAQRGAENALRGADPVRRDRRASIGQVRASDGFRWPQFRLPVSRIGVYFIASVLFVIAIVVGLGILRNTPVDIHPNTIWLGTEWTYESQTAEQVAALARRLDTHRIGRVYAWVSWLQDDRTWRAEDQFADVQAFVSAMRTADPELELMAWISLPVDAGSGYRLDDPGVQQAVAEFARRTVDEFGFDGVFLNIEPVWDGDEAFLALLRRVRAEVGADVPISAAIPPDWSPEGAAIPVPPLISPGTEWSEAYKQSVALLVDEMALMAYNSGLSDAADYSVWVAYQVAAYARALAALGAGTDLIVGIPTYDAEPPGHDPAVENVRSAVAGIVQGMADAGDAAAVVRGTALYAGWTTDEAEWGDYLAAWVSR